LIPVSNWGLFWETRQFVRLDFSEKSNFIIILRAMAVSDGVEALEVERAIHSGAVQIRDGEIEQPIEIVACFDL